MSKPAPAVSQEKPECFVIMPISDHDAYVKGHFQRVYDDIVRPACDKAGFKPLRADEVKQTNLIHLDILQRLLEAPMAICDLSTANPNVLFELGLRQAFDKPVVLMTEEGSKPIFDISFLRYTRYRKARIYHEVIEDQAALAIAIAETFQASQTGDGVNSIVKLLALVRPAGIPHLSPEEKEKDIAELVLSELSQVRKELREIRRPNNDIQNSTVGQLVDGTVDKILGDANALIAEWDAMKGTALTHDAMRTIDRKIRSAIETCNTAMISFPQTAPRIADTLHRLIKERDTVRKLRFKQAVVAG